MPDHHELPALAANAANASLESMTASHATRATLSLASGRSTGDARTQASRSVAPVMRTQPGGSNAVDTVPLKRLTAGRKALKIAHAGETYLLRITKANKLILTKPAADEKPYIDAKV